MHLPGPVLSFETEVNVEWQVPLATLEDNVQPQKTSEP
jgi:hypothetical protein